MDFENYIDRFSGEIVVNKFGKFLKCKSKEDWRVANKVRYYKLCEPRIITEENGVEYAFFELTSHFSNIKMRADAFLKSDIGILLKMSLDFDSNGELKLVPDHDVSYFYKDSRFTSHPLSAFWSAHIHPNGEFLIACPTSIYKNGFNTACRIYNFNDNRELFKISEEMPNGKLFVRTELNEDGNFEITYREPDDHYLTERGHFIMTEDEVRYHFNQRVRKEKELSSEGLTINDRDMFNASVKDGTLVSKIKEIKDSLEHK